MDRAYAIGVGDAFTKFAANMSPDNVKHVLEIAGLGALAIPVIHHLSKAKDRTDKVMGATELGGLGILAAPSVAGLLGH